MNSAIRCLSFEVKLENDMCVSSKYSRHCNSGIRVARGYKGHVEEPSEIQLCYSVNLVISYDKLNRGRNVDTEYIQTCCPAVQGSIDDIVLVYH